MDYYRPGAERGAADFGWLHSKHTFSFGGYYDPKHMGFSVLRVINDDYVAAGAGFDTHGHRDMEIISYITEGAIEHRDSMGNHFVVPAGEVQRMTAGTGITHSEFNASKSQPLRFLQIWIKPKFTGLKPGYEQLKLAQTSALTPLVTPDGHAGSLTIHQDAAIYRLRLAAGQEQVLTTAARYGYLHLVRGSALVDGRELQAGDGLGYSEAKTVSVSATRNDFEALWFDLPAVPN
ncbi:pirin family protein [Halioxenophilus sp. WMMB6]|uniref:pirin family protein n=1 Tax=Halioxenophilus sp. WMMB6 TaxID=3073815 RepID=UPI00295F3430|nr:pirin family protein [Halioxenophilus sp. WMMB6]